MKKAENSVFVKHLQAFSLAEALITLLIVCLVTIASVPILTKKKKDTTKSVHGKWVCTIKDGSHYVWTSSDRTWENSGSSCTFVPPTNARNFAITAVGGGGGGAGAQSESMMKQGTQDFQVEYYGVYKMALVGGGGQGGKHNCGRSGGGGAGGVGYMEYEITSDAIQVKMVKGVAQTTSNFNGINGTSSYIDVVYKDPSGNNRTQRVFTADGGGGGGGRYKGGSCKGSGDGGGQGGVYSPTGTPYKAFNTGGGAGAAHCDLMHCFGYTPVSKQLELNELMKPYTVFNVYNSAGGLVSDRYSEQIGRGGNPTSAQENPYYPREGKDGYVIVTTEIYGAGGGGGAAPEPAIKQFYPSFDAKKLKVTVGAGGKGGAKGVNGSDGGVTNVGDLIVRLGGKGGTIEYTKRAYIDTPGGDGGKSPLFYSEEPTPGYGGLSGTNSDVNGLTSEGYGAGGGGGGVKPDTEPGNGADGSPGVVIIEW